MKLFIRLVLTMGMLLGVSAQGMKVVKQAKQVKTTGFNKTSSAPVNRTYSSSSTGFDKNTVEQGPNKGQITLKKSTPLERANTWRVKYDNSDEQQPLSNLSKINATITQLREATPGWPNFSQSAGSPKRFGYFNQKLKNTNNDTNDTGSNWGKVNARITQLREADPYGFTGFGFGAIISAIGVGGYTLYDYLRSKLYGDKDIKDE